MMYESQDGSEEISGTVVGTTLLVETAIDGCEHMNVQLGFGDDAEACLYPG
jgi:hypothetical protein